MRNVLLGTGGILLVALQSEAWANRTAAAWAVPPFARIAWGVFAWRGRACLFDIMLYFVAFAKKSTSALRSSAEPITCSGILVPGV